MDMHIDTCTHMSLMSVSVISAFLCMVFVFHFIALKLVGHTAGLYFHCMSIKKKSCHSATKCAVVGISPLVDIDNG